MTRSILIDGVERADLARVESLRITNTAGDDISSGLGEVILDDVDGTLVDDGNPPAVKKPWIAIEDATASPTVLGFGRIATFETQRHSVNDYLDRQVEWKLYLEGPNIELSGFDVHGQARPIETDWQRFQWVAATYLNGSPRASTVLDATTYAPNTNTVSMPAKTYNNSDVPDVIRDCMEQADKICFVTVDSEIFYDQKDSTAYTSSISISDRIADVNQTTVFEPIWDQGAALTNEGQTYASRLRMAYGSQQTVLVGPDGSEADHDYWVGRTASSDPISAAEATAIASGELAFRAKGVRTYSLSLLLANDQVDLIKHGQRIQIEARAAVDVDNAYEYRRIAQLQWEVESPEFYWAHLQLDQPILAHARNRRGQPVTNSQSDLISPCPCIETFNRVVAADGAGISDLNAQTWVIDSVLGDIFVDGSEAVFDYAGQMHLPIYTAMDNSRFEVLFKARIEGPTPADPRGYLDFRWVGGGGSPGAGARIKVRARETGSDTELAVDVTFSENGEGVANGYDFGTQVTYPYVSGGEDFYVHLSVDRNTLNASIWLASGGEPAAWMMTLNGSPTINYNNSNGLVDTLYLETTNTASSEWHVDFIQVLAGMWCCDGTPAPGQFVTEIDIGHGDGTATSFFVPFAYGDNSLRVWVDGIEQTSAVTETDPSTGEFSLSFTPQASELITVSFRAA